MSIIKSFSVGNGDMFYIRHGNDSFTIIDCCLDDENKAKIVEEIKSESSDKGISRFISTHPDDDHIRQLDYLDDKISIVNFYCVKNEATKADPTDSFDRYCELRGSEKKAFYLFKGCSRKWMNESSDERGCSGIHIIWPDTANSTFKEALTSAAQGESPNNISPIIKYSLTDGATFLWMGDLETEFMEAVEDEIALPKVNILFAPHHGRDSGKVPSGLLNKMKPDIIIIGEAPSDTLHYYPDYNTITQNSAGDILFDCSDSVVHIFTSKKYSVSFLTNKYQTKSGYYYLGSLEV